MISYLILVLTVSLVICSPLEHDQSLVDDRHIAIQERSFTGKSKELLSKLVQTLKNACDKGIEGFVKVINDPDVKELLNHMDSLTRKIAESLIQTFKEVVEKIDKATKVPAGVQKRDSNDSSYTLLKKLIDILTKAYEKGAKAFDDAIEDPDIKSILNSLNGIARKSAMVFIEKFKKLIKKVNEVTKDDFTLEKRDVKESSKALLKRLVQILVKSYRKGSEYFNKVINDPDVQGILNNMNLLKRKVAESVIQHFKELVNKIDEATKVPAGVQKRDSFKESSYSLLKKLINILTEAYNKGSKAFYKALEDPDVKAIIGSLNGIARKSAEVFIEKFKKLVIYVDNATNNVPKTSKRKTL